jgi:hypothetical protein
MVALKATSDKCRWSHVAGRQSPEDEKLLLQFSFK